jgi:integrase
MALTVKSVEAAAPHQERREIPDGYLKGLYLIVQPSGRKSWAVRYRRGGHSHKLTLGSYPLLDLKMAREAGLKALRAVSEGRDPSAKPTSDNVQAVVDRFIQHRVRGYRPRPRAEAERLLRIYVLNNWGKRRIGEISRPDIRDLLDKVAEHAPVMANRIHSVIRCLFNWAVEQEIIATSPMRGLKRPASETTRDRVLTDDELKQIWVAASSRGPFGQMVRLLILTGQRRGEVAGMRWDELDLKDRVWTLPKERVKNKRLHEVPLSPQAVALIDVMPHLGEFVFTWGGKHPITNFVKTDLDALCGVSKWTLHDLRRTVASGMARLGISLAVIEKILNHVSGSFAGIVGVYQRHEFAEEKRAALDKWAAHVERLVR